MKPVEPPTPESAPPAPGASPSGAPADGWRRAADALPSMLLITDSDGVILDMNRGAAEFLSAPIPPATPGAAAGAEAGIGSCIHTMGPGEPWPTASRLARQAAAAGAPAAEPWREEQSGRVWSVSVSPSPGSAGSDGRLVVMACDVTRLMAQQRERNRSGAMSRLGSLIGGMAHEVRNPLFTISATIDAFEARFGAAGDNRRYIETLRAAVNQLNNLMQLLLDYGRPPEIRTAPGTIDRAVLPAVERLLPRAEGAGVRLENRVPPGLPPVPMDRDRISQAVHNLVQNALEYTPGGGTITVRAGEVFEEGRRWIECRVEDTGPSIPEEDLLRVFEPFFNQHYGGTGLGLPTAQRIVEQHGGLVRARNLPEGGAAISLLLPLAEG